MFRHMFPPQKNEKEEWIPLADFVILTDSSADLGADLVSELNIEVLPLSFTMGGRTYRDFPDNREMTPADFYRRLREGEWATTSAVNMDQYTSILTPILQSGRDVLILAFSSGLSTTYNSASMAAEELRAQFPARRVLVVDTLCASLGQGLLVYLAAKQREKGLSLQQVRDWCVRQIPTLSHQFTVDDLHHLKRGGRISAATAMVGSMLQIKPVLHVDQQGKLINIGKARGRKAALTALVDRMERTVRNPDGQIVFLSHSDCLEDAQWVADQVKARLGIRKFYINYIGPVIGAHTGPGCVALFYIGDR